MKIRRKRYRRQLELARSTGYIDGQAQLRQLTDLKLRSLRDRVYELENTPEIKADTEAAFAQGISHGKILVRAALMEMLTTMGTDGSSPLPVPEIKPKLDPLPKPPSTQHRESDGGRNFDAAE